MSLLLIRGGVNMMIASWLITLSARARARFSVDEQSDQMLHAVFQFIRFFFVVCVRVCCLQIGFFSGYFGFPFLKKKFRSTAYTQHFLAKSLNSCPSIDSLVFQIFFSFV